MSSTHLKDLRSELERTGWVVSSVLEGYDYDISGVWVVSRPARKLTLHLEFQGLDESNVLPMEKSYGCKVREHSEVCAYFSRKHRSWPDELLQFTSKINSL